MSRQLIAPLTASALAWALFAGCSPPPQEAEPAPEAKATGDAMPTDVFAEDEAGAVAEAEPDAVAEAEPDAVAVTLDDEQIELIRQLPEADAEIALAQKVCPISDEPLGSMGVPIKVMVKDTPVFICCDGCEDGVAEDADAILARVPQGKPKAPEAEAEAGAPEGAGS